MKNIIKKIILDSDNNIKIGNCFDSHLIIKLLIEKYSDDYFKFMSNHIDFSKTDIAKTTHNLLAKEIKKLTKDNSPILEQIQECKSVSFNIHKKISSCTLWKRRR